MSIHTPGPWRARYLPQHRMRVDADNGSTTICDIALWTVDYGEQIANTALIAAAPSMYEIILDAQPFVARRRSESPAAQELLERIEKLLSSLRDDHI